MTALVTVLRCGPRVVARGMAVGAVLIALPTAAALAQTSTADLQAIGQAAAAKYGVPWSILDAQIQAESGWDPNTPNSTAGAEGIAQFLPSTAQSLGVNPNDPTSALHGAAEYDAQLYQQTGSWTSALTAYSGGLTPADPKSYADAFEAAQVADANVASNPSGTAATDPSTGAGQDPALTVSMTDPAPAVTGGPSTSATFSGSTFKFFSWIWNEYQSAIAAPLQGEIQQIQAKAWGPMNGLVTLDFIAAGGMLLLGVATIGRLWRKLLALCAVVLLLSPANPAYQNLVVKLFTNLPAWISAAAVTGSVNGPAGLYDQVASNFWSHVSSAASKVSLLHESGILDYLLIAFSIVVVFAALCLMFVVWIVVQALMEILFILGPILILGLLFEWTRQFFDRWLGALVMLALISLAANLLPPLLMTVITAALNQIGPTNTALVDAENLFCVSLVTLILSAAVALLPRLLETIAAASGSPSMSHAHNWLSRNVYSRPGQAVGAAARPPRP